MTERATTAAHEPARPEQVRPAASERAAPDRRGILWLRMVYAVSIVLTALTLWFAIAQPVQVLPRIRPAPAFTLTDQTGRWFGEGDLRGRIALVSFGYTRCGVDCADLDARLQATRGQLRSNGALGQRVQLLTISLDPEHDTPARLRGYAALLGAEPDEWRLLTGIPAEVKQLVGGELGVYYTRAGERIEFDRRAVLIDGSGVIRAEYDATQLDPAIVMRDVGLIEREAASGQLERPIYEAAHVFVCYPE